MKWIFLLIIISCTFLQAADSYSKQVWGNYVMGSDYSDKLFFKLDLGPKVQVKGDENWRNLNIKPIAEYYPLEWIDLTAEVVLGYTNQTNEIESFEVSPRIGIRFHILGSIRQYLRKNNLIIFSRFNISAFFRYEYRNVWYNNSTEDHQSRFRARLETKTAFNHKTYNQDDTYYIFADFEKYFNIGKDIEEIFSHKLRTRIGPGYRYNDSHRFEALVIYDQAKDTINDDPHNDAFALDVRYIMVF